MTKPRDPDTQCARILAHLRSGPITPREALQHYGCMRLAARIQELEADGFTMDVEMVTENGATFARYTLRVTDAQLEEAGQMAMFK